MRRLPPCVLVRRASSWSWPARRGRRRAVWAPGWPSLPTVARRAPSAAVKIELFALDEARELLSAGQSRLVRYTMGGENSDTGMMRGGAICLCYLHLDATQAPLFQSVADVLAYRRIGDFVIDFEPFIASALEGDVAEYHGEESRRTIAGCPPGFPLVEGGSNVTYTNAASEIPAAHRDALPRGPDLHLWLRTRGRCDGARAHGGGLCRRGLATTVPAR